MSVGENIKKNRTIRGWTQARLAKESGVSRISIGNYERGDREPTVGTAISIASAFGIPLSDLLERDTNRGEELGYLLQEKERLENELYQDNLSEEAILKIIQRKAEVDRDYNILAFLKKKSNDDIIFKMENPMSLELEKVLSLRGTSAFDSAMSNFEEKFKLEPGTVKMIFDDEYNMNEIIMDIGANYSKIFPTLTDIVISLEALNLTGQQEAAKRINELTYIEKYTNDDSEDPNNPA